LASPSAAITKTNAIPTFHAARAAVFTVTNRSDCLYLHEPRADWAPVRNKITPKMLVGKWTMAGLR